MSGNAGSGHSRSMRLSSIALLPLTVYSVIIVVSLVGADYATTIARLSSPLVWLPLLAFLLITAWHMWLGMHVIIDDYARGRAASLLNALSMIFTLLVVAIAVYAIYQLSFGA